MAEGKVWIKETGKLLHQPKALLVVWIIMAVFSGAKQYSDGTYNNYKIFKGVYTHTLQEKNLYLEYPDEYFDSNHYGPFFSVVFAPFAVLPDWLGTVGWNLLNVLLLYYALFKLPIENSYKVGIGWLITNELWTSLVNQQSNPAIAAGILLSFAFVISKKDQWSTGYIAAGTLVKLYSIVGLAFFFFSRHKIKFILTGIGWAIVLFFLPALFSSVDFNFQSYLDWYESLSVKDVLNQTSPYQDISLIGLIRRISGYQTLSSLWVIAPGGLLFIWAYLQPRYFDKSGFQMLVLIEVMIGLNIFSSSTESSTYIIGFTAVCIWFVMHQRPWPKTVLYLFIFAFILTSLSPTDLFPKVARVFIRQYSLKALPCVIVWFYVIWQMLTYSKQQHLQKEFQAN